MKYKLLSAMACLFHIVPVFSMQNIASSSSNKPVITVENQASILRKLEDDCARVLAEKAAPEIIHQLSQAYIVCCGKPCAKSYEAYEKASMAAAKLLEGKS